MKKIIPIIILSVFALGAVYFLASRKGSIPGSAPSLLGNMETDKYVFYYPSSFVKGESEGSEQFYMPAVDNNGEGISVFYIPADAESEVRDASNNFCMLLTQAYISVRLKDFPVKPIVENVTAGNPLNEVQECHFTAMNPVAEGDRLTMSVRTLWHKGQNDRFVVQTFYWNTTKPEDASALNASVAAFRLK